MDEQVGKMVFTLPELARRIGLPEHLEITAMRVQVDPPLVEVFVRGEVLYLSDGLSGWEHGGEAPFLAKETLLAPVSARTTDARQGRHLRHRAHLRVSAPALAEQLGFPPESVVSEVAYEQDPSGFVITVEHQDVPISRLPKT